MHQLLRMTFALLLAISASTYLTGCGKSDSGSTGNQSSTDGESGEAAGTAPDASTEGEPSASAESKYKIAFITNTVADFWEYARAGVADAEATFGDVEVEFRFGDGTSGKQKEIVEDLLTRGVKGIAISPVAPAQQSAQINRWIDNDGAIIICQDSDAPDSKRAAYLGTDNVEAGRQCGELIKEALPDGGKIMCFVGLKDQQNAIERYQGIKEALEGTNIEVLDLRADNGERGKARENAEDTLTKYPDIAGLVGLWSYNAPAILAAVNDAGKLGQVKIIAFDEDPNTLTAIDEGHIHGTVVQDPYEFGRKSVELLRSLLQGQTASDVGVPENGLIYVPTNLIRKGEGVKAKEHYDSLKAKVNK